MKNRDIVIIRPVRIGDRSYDVGDLMSAAAELADQLVRQGLAEEKVEQVEKKPRSKKSED